MASFVYCSADYDTIVFCIFLAGMASFVYCSADYDALVFSIFPAGMTSFVCCVRAFVRFVGAVCRTETYRYRHGVPSPVCVKW
ncbi:hypothetical protein [Bacteroides pyogenes]|uniref:hypothetical protein n=1 Tax=Bacteroides pyogenes TaxID=310300 RepID=UPI001BA59E41|nr:hypothetical protein [Bacteroides pyogenes]